MRNLTLCVLLTFCLGCPEQPEVPSVVGLTQSVAEAVLMGAGLTVGTVSTAYSDAVAAGNVIGQNPAAATSASSGTAVDLVVSLGPEVDPGPDFTIAIINESPYSITEIWIQAPGFSSQEFLRGDTLEPGEVFEHTFPTPGTVTMLVYFLGEGDEELWDMIVLPAPENPEDEPHWYYDWYFYGEATPIKAPPRDEPEAA